MAQQIAEYAKAGRPAGSVPPATPPPDPFSCNGNSAAGGDGSCARRGCRPESPLRHHSPHHSRLFCTPFLAYGASTVFIMVAAGVPLAVAGLVFPAGYVTLSFLGLEMATGSFALMPIGMYAGTATPMELVRNWTWILTGNLLGGIFFAWLLWFSWTYGGSVAPPVRARGSCSWSFPRPPSTRSSTCSTAPWAGAPPLAWVSFVTGW